MRSRASSFKWQYPYLSLRSYSSFLGLLPRLLVTSISPFIFPSITCFRRHKIWPIQLAFRFLISCRIFLCSLTLSNTSSFLTWSVQLIFSILLHHHPYIYIYIYIYTHTHTHTHIHKHIYIYIYTNIYVPCIINVLEQGYMSTWTLLQILSESF